MRQPLLAAIVVALGVTLAGDVAAQLRRIPDDAKRGTFTAGPIPAVEIDGKPYRLAPGARILGPNNSTVTPNQVPPKSTVRYQLDGQGQVRVVWVLTAAEAATK